MDIFERIYWGKMGLSRLNISEEHLTVQTYPKTLDIKRRYKHCTIYTCWLKGVFPKLVTSLIVYTGRTSIRWKSCFLLLISQFEIGIQILWFLTKKSLKPRNWNENKKNMDLN